MLRLATSAARGQAANPRLCACALRPFSAATPSGQTVQKAFKDQVKPKQAEAKEPAPPVKKAGEANGANGASAAKKAEEAKSKPASGADPARAKQEVESVKKEVAKKDPGPKAKPAQTPPPAPEMPTQGFVDNFTPKIVVVGVGGAGGNAGVLKNLVYLFLSY